MAELNSTEVVDVSNTMWTNWGAEGAPPIIMNPAASTHALIAWCCAEADEAFGLASIGTGTLDSYELSSLISAIRGRLQALVTVLEEVGERSRKREPQPL